MRHFRSVARWVRNVLITALVMVFATFTVGPLVLPHVGADLLAVRSGSMAPAIPTGSLVLITDYSPDEARSIPVGEVITFSEPGHQGKLVTHRVNEVKASNGEVAYATKGDANGIVDSWQVRPSDIEGSPMFSLANAGYLYVFLTSWPMRIGIALLILVLAWFPQKEERDAEQPVEARSNA